MDEGPFGTTCSYFKLFRMQIKQLFLPGCLQNLFIFEADHICVKSCPLVPSFNYTPTMSNRQSFLAPQFLESVDEAISDIKKRT